MRHLTASARVRLCAVALALLAGTATLLAVIVHPWEAALAHLAILAGVVVVGLMTNALGGMLGAGTGVLVIVLLNRYLGTYPRESQFLNLGTQAGATLLVGLAAGLLADGVKAMEREGRRWLTRAEERAVHDETLDVLKPQWARVRLQEEMERADCFNRPLSVMMLHIDAGGRAHTPDRGERVAILQALIRTVRSIVPAHCTVGHVGGDHILVVLPEHTGDAAAGLVDALRTRLAQEVYFLPTGAGRALGRPIGEWGAVRLAAFPVEPAESPDALLDRLTARVNEGEDV